MVQTGCTKFFLKWPNLFCKIASSEYRALGWCLAEAHNLGPLSSILRPGTLMCTKSRPCEVALADRVQSGGQGVFEVCVQE